MRLSIIISNFPNYLSKTLCEKNLKERKSFPYLFGYILDAFHDFLIQRYRHKGLMNCGFSSDYGSLGRKSLIQIYPHTLQIISRWTFGSFSHTGRRAAVRFPSSVLVKRPTMGPTKRVDSHGP